MWSWQDMNEMFLQLRQEFHACKQTSSRCSRNAVFQSSSFYCPGRSPPQEVLPKEVTFASKSTFELHSWPYAVSLCCSENVEPDNLVSWTQLANLFGFSQRHFSSHPWRFVSRYLREAKRSTDGDAKCVLRLSLLEESSNFLAPWRK